MSRIKQTLAIGGEKLKNIEPVLNGAKGRAVSTLAIFAPFISGCGRLDARNFGPIEYAGIAILAVGLFFFATGIGRKEL